MSEKKSDPKGTIIQHQEKCGHKYSRSSRKRPPRELEKVVVTRAGRLRECKLVSDQQLKQ